VAEGFGGRYRDGAVYWAVVEPRRVLARFDELQTDEHVIDTSGLDVREFPLSMLRAMAPGRMPLAEAPSQDGHLDTQLAD
jgi:hypothetical protein